MGLAESKLKEPTSWVAEVRKTCEEELVAYRVDSLDVTFLYSMRSNAEFFLVHPHSTLAFYYYEVAKMVRLRDDTENYFRNVASALLQLPERDELDHRTDTKVPFIEPGAKFLRIDPRSLLKEKRDWVPMDFSFLFWGLYNTDVVMGLHNWMAMVRAHNCTRPLERFASDWLRGEQAQNGAEEEQSAASEAIAKVVRSTEIACVRTLQKFLERPKRDRRNVVAICSAAEMLISFMEEDEVEHVGILDEADEPPPAPAEAEKDEDLGESESSEEGAGSEEEGEDEILTIRVRAKDLRALQRAIEHGKIK